MTAEKNWRNYERHPISARYEDIKGMAWKQFLEHFEKHGPRDRRIILHEGKVLDGWQLYRACLYHDVVPQFANLRDGEDPEEYVEKCNDLRRHESQQTASNRVSERRKRILEANLKGKSTRTIAAEEGVSQATVIKDIKVQEAAVEEGAVEAPPVESNGKVVGKDGKERQARVINPPKHRKREPAPVETQLKDAYGNTIPKKRLDAYNDPWITETTDFLGEFLGEFWERRLADNMEKRKRAYPTARPNDFNDGVGFVGNHIQALIDHLKEIKPAGVCPKCDGDGCPACRMSGLVNRADYEAMVKDAGVKAVSV